MDDVTTMHVLKAIANLLHVLPDFLLGHPSLLPQTAEQTPS